VFKEPLSLTLRSSYQLIKSRNVVAVLDGSDSLLKHEYVGFGAHYDHIGVQDTLIFNGADDDGSGTVGVLNIAQAFAASRPKRSIFINFHTGEEKGLLGSAFFADNPLLPLENLVAMVNIDMIGSDYQNERVHIVGADRISRELHDINEFVNQARSGMVLDYTFNDDKHPEQIYYRSDHYNYAKKGVPVIFYTNENPKHYHKHTDEVSTINFDKLERIARLAYQTGFYVANKPDRLKINPPVESK
jgi:Zn-dependent M28 family amino/carboxypeptidase